MKRFSELSRGPLPPVVQLEAKELLGATESTDIHSLYELIRCLASGHAVQGVVQRFASWDNDVAASNGMVPYPHPGEQAECLVSISLIGYDTGSCRVTFTSDAIPPEWGDQGKGYLLFGYVERYVAGMVAHLPLLA